MKIEFLQSLGMTEILQSKTSKLCDTLMSYSEIQFKDIFVEEYTNADGTRVFEDVVLWSDNYLAGASLVEKASKIDGVLLERTVLAWRLDAQNYDFQNANDSSTVKLDIQFMNNPQVHSVLKASKQNCDHLVKLIKTYVIPNILRAHS